MFIRRAKLIALLEKLQERDNLRYRLQEKFSAQLRDLKEKYPDADTSRWLFDRASLEKEIAELDEEIEGLEEEIGRNYRRGPDEDVGLSE